MKTQNLKVTKELKLTISVKEYIDAGMTHATATAIFNNIGRVKNAYHKSGEPYYMVTIEIPEKYSDDTSVRKILNEATQKLDAATQKSKDGELEQIQTELVNKATSIGDAVSKIKIRSTEPLGSATRRRMQYVEHDLIGLCHTINKLLDMYKNLKEDRESLNKRFVDIVDENTDLVFECNTIRDRYDELGEEHEKEITKLRADMLILRIAKEAVEKELKKKRENNAKVDENPLDRSITIKASVVMKGIYNMHKKFPGCDMVEQLEKKFRTLMYDVDEYIRDLQKR